MKYIIASHGKMAWGMKKTIEMLIGEREDLFALTAYVESQDFLVEVKTLLKKFAKDELIYIFTDILGGSVSQTIAMILSEYNIQLISGVNLPLVLQIILRDESLSDEEIDKLVEQARQQIIHVNKI
ncbi:MAG: PTS sugar transporter subunit IIA [Erysipelotrichia bacterium]|nr:PTS sugar transporter subunit IIA [Erysipelotrichia bacterium]